jgi:maleylacetate reductase
VTLRFSHVTLAQRVLFGTDRAAANLAAEVDRLQAQAVMVIVSARERAAAGRVLADIAPALIHDEVEQHVPIENAERARAVAGEHGIDLIVCIGGGSTTGLAKAIALTSGVPIVAVPTTYAGSEATNVWGLTEGKRKSTGVDDRVLPVSVIYDASLTVSLPGDLTVASGLNALAHCVDGLWAPRADPINSALAVEGIRALSAALPAVHRDPGDIAAREQCLYGAYLSAVAFASAGSGLHHKICHALGGAYHLPHAQTHATVLPHVLAFNADAAPDAARRVAQAFGARGTSPQDAVEAVEALRVELDAPHALRDYGFDAAQIPEAVALILPSVPPSNPRHVTAENLAALLHDAWAGATPTRRGDDP